MPTDAGVQPWSPAGESGLTYAVDADVTGSFRETILVVDDEPGVRASICRVLRRYGYDILEARDGEDALRVLQHYHAPVPLVISDIMMPELSGTDLIEMLHGWYPRMRVLFISGYSPESVDAREDLADCSFLAKPFSMNALTQRVRELLDAYHVASTLAATG